LIGTDYRMGAFPRGRDRGPGKTARGPVAGIIEIMMRRYSLAAE
jgi:hypothetical protein